MIFEKDLIQGSAEWLQWRRERICGTDAATILGVSSFMTMSQLYDEKIGLEIPKPPNARMMLGSKLESEARTCFNDLLNLDCEPAVVTCSKWPWLSCSLDGISSDHKKIVEIKCSDYYYRTAVADAIPESIRCQLQTQLCVTGLDNMFYFCYWKGKYSSTRIERDQDFIDDMIPKLFDFWKCIQNLELPKGYNEDRFVKG